MGTHDESWPTRLALACTPDDVAWADETARRYALGGRSRAALLAEGGERHGGFGANIGPDQFALLLDGLRHSAAWLLALLESEKAGILAGEGALVVAVGDYLASRRAERAAATEATAKQGELEQLVDGAVDHLADRLAERLEEQHARTEAERRAEQAVLVLVVEPRPAAGFLRSLDRVLRRGKAR